MIFYALFDNPEDERRKKGSFPVNATQAKELNEQGYGIHWLPQLFKNGGRTAADLEKIRYWVADLDDGDKKTMLRRIDACPIQPTFIVETKRGYHVYWEALDATIANYPGIETGIAEFLCADKQLATPAHMLRAPGFYHLKDPKNPFLVKTIWKNQDNKYNESLMLRVFGPKQKKESKKKYMGIIHDNNIKELVDPKNWDKIWKVNQITSGGRNNRLSDIAFGLMRAGADESTVRDVLLDMNNTLAQPLGKSEVENIVKNKFNKGVQK